MSDADSLALPGLATGTAKAATVRLPWRSAVADVQLPDGGHHAPARDDLERAAERARVDPGHSNTLRRMPPGYPDCAAKTSRPRLGQPLLGATGKLSWRSKRGSADGHTRPRSRAAPPGRVDCRLRGLLRLGVRGQRLIVCPLLEAALELFRSRRCCPPWMPNDPYDLAHAPTPTASCRRPIRGGRALAVSAAALTDHVRDRWHWTARLPEVGFPFGGSARRLRIEKPRNLRRSRSRSVACGEGRQ